MNTKLRLDSVDWKEFKVSDVFTYTRGKRHIEKNRKNGNLPYYSASSINNGITDFINNPLFTSNNKLLVSTFCDSFFAEGKFTASDEMTMLNHIKLSKETGIFITTIIKSNKNKYAFGRKAFSERIKKQLILLPVDHQCELNWQFMEDYIKQEQRVQYKKIIDYYEKKLSECNTDRKISLSDVEWKEFKVSDVFNIINTKTYHKKDLSIINHNNTGIPYITRTSFNNGMDSIVVNDNIHFFNENNVITLGAENAEFFYQPYKFITGNNICIIKNKMLNNSNGLFVVQIFRQSVKNCGFGFGKGLTGTRFSDKQILIPIDEKGEPNWQFMEDYIKQEQRVQYQKIIDYYKKCQEELVK